MTVQTAEQPRIFRRNDPGTKREWDFGVSRPTFFQDWCRWPPLAFDDMDSTLNVQQYIQQTIQQNPADIDLILTPPPDLDDGVWKYEHLRQFCLQLNGLAFMLQEECNPETCIQMTATEQWIFLCAAHKNPKECSAIDYTRHTLDGAASLLNSNKYFPSRINIKESSLSKLGSVCRRVYRIFSHAYFHHRQLFDEFETSTHLCKRSVEFVSMMITLLYSVCLVF
ncbi:unnamed protein product [Haemonchus placei]|uniref:MOB-like protein phocein n=1 Tax=Haemonchus placei TaxID=6290 RepID=A0A0N4WUJ9_HAEPC|nr:unnamed protein product [Haemonchus placei]